MPLVAERRGTGTVERLSGYHDLAKDLLRLVVVNEKEGRIHESAKESASGPKNTMTFRPDSAQVLAKDIGDRVEDQVEGLVCQFRQVGHAPLDRGDFQSVSLAGILVLLQLDIGVVEGSDIGSGCGENRYLLSAA